MKILFVLENYHPHIGGVEVLFKNLAEGLVKKGYEVKVITHRIKNTKKFEILNGVKIYRISCLNNRYLFTFFSIPKAIYLARDADIIHTTTFNGAFPAWFASKILRKRCIITIHEVWVNKWNELTEMNKINAWVHNKLEKLIYLLNFDRYVAVSESTKSQLLSVCIKKEKVDVVYNGVDYGHWSPNKYDGQMIKKELGLLKGKFIYLFSGRPGTSKGLEYLIKAVPIISKAIKDSKLLLIISKDKAYKKQYDSIIKLIKQLRIEKNIFIHNPLPYNELPSYVKSVNCVVVPSLSEGFGFAVAEACAMNIPVVASDAGSIPEIVSGKYILVKPKDEKSIAEGIIKIYNKRYNKKTLKKFTVIDNVLGYLNIYKSMTTKGNIG
jgi:glycosyltransferase involved in cell wall biosynthesis